MPRFYIPNTTFQIGEEVVLPQESVHHAMRVLRMRDGDEAELFDGRGTSAKGTIHFAKDFASVKVLGTTVAPENSLRIVLLQSLVSNEKMDWIIEKACELDVSEVIVFPADRSEVKLAADKLSKRMERWQNKDKVESVSFVIGPEGGLSPREINLLEEKGFKPQQLGKLVFRTETAGIVAASYAHTLWDWK